MKIISIPKPYIVRIKRWHGKIAISILKEIGIKKSARVWF